MNSQKNAFLIGRLTGLVQDIEKVDYYFCTGTYGGRVAHSVIVDLGSVKQNMPHDTAFRLGFDPRICDAGVSLIARQMSGKSVKNKPKVGENIVVLMVARRGSEKYVPALWVQEQTALELLDTIRKDGIIRVYNAENAVCWIGPESKMPPTYYANRKERKDADSETWTEVSNQPVIVQPDESSLRTLASTGLGMLARAFGGSPVRLTA